MASEIVEKGALVLYQQEAARSANATRLAQGINPAAVDHMEPFEACADTTWRPDAKAVLLAFLDAIETPISDAMVDAGRDEVMKDRLAGSGNRQTKGAVACNVWTAMVRKLREEVADG